MTGVWLNRSIRLIWKVLLWQGCGLIAFINMYICQWPFNPIIWMLYVTSIFFFAFCFPYPYRLTFIYFSCKNNKIQFSFYPLKLTFPDKFIMSRNCLFWIFTFLQHHKNLASSGCPKMVIKISYFLTFPVLQFHTHFRVWVILIVEHSTVTEM
jgi:hypothetical protein